MTLQSKYIDEFHKGLTNLCKDECFTDITIDVEGKHFPCHKLVLSAMSPYFKIMFTVDMAESKKSIITLPTLQADVFEMVLEFLYTGQNLINSDTAVKLLEASNFMQIEILQHECELYLETQMLNVDNCLTLWHLAKNLSAKSLENKTFQFILDNFSKIVMKPEFCDLELYEIKLILEHEFTDLPGEDELSEALLKWLEKDVEGRKDHIKAIFGLLRLPFVSGEYLFHQLGQEHTDLIAKYELSPLVDEAKKYFTLPARQPEFWTESTRQRPASLFEDVVMVIEGMGKTSNCYAYSFHRKAWYQLSSVPDYRRSGVSACAFGQFTVYLSGGKTSNADVSAKMIKFDGRTNEWTDVVTLPVQCIMYHNMTIVSKGIYIIGGFSKIKDQVAVSSKIYCYDITTDNLKESGSLIYPVHTSTTAVCNGKIIIFGGFASFPVVQGYSAVVKVQCFDPRYSTTTVVTDLPALLGSKTVGFDDYILLVTPMGKVLKVSLEEKTYDEIGEIPNFSRGRFEVIKQNESLFLIGGTGKDGINGYHKDMLRFNLESNEVSKELVPCGITSAVKIVVKKEFLMKSELMECED